MVYAHLWWLNVVLWHVEVAAFVPCLVTASIVVVVTSEVLTDRGWSVVVV